MYQFNSSIALAEKVSWYCGLFLAIMLVLSWFDQYNESEFIVQMQQQKMVREKMPCDEIYVVREGETLQTISEKCGDPFIVEENPHIHDPDDVFPGLIIKITPFKNNR
ncbi:uncharacterized protein [Nicotiana tomentosiformis]|uniref:LysM domain-containing protein n=1 Tax=Nicotiana tabacum TaxID=4097 RepID=A0A1S4DFP9_TOBAC|nr:uncharacterized protein LOC104113099 [Nicotiana tomentosiformis]XP_016512287.1 PREDICTED: uncharacterized protein LOC107829327 [Nicotiana tabacum]